MLQKLRHRMVSSWLDVSRLPADVATRLLPDGEGGTRARAQVFVDKADAAARTVVGGILRDEELRADGTRRRIAADERLDAMRLRGVAEEKKLNAERRKQQAKTKAKQHAEQAQVQAQKAIAQVAEQAEDRKERVETEAEAAERRVQEQRQAEVERTDKETKRARLAAVEDRAEALDAEADALTAADEAKRLADAAAAAKAERKQGTG